MSCRWSRSASRACSSAWSAVLTRPPRCDAPRSWRNLAANGRVLSTPTFNLGVFALWTDGPEAAELLRDSRDDAIARGDEGSAPMVLAQLALAEYLAGRWDEAARVAGEGFELALQTGQRPMQAYSLATRALVRASLGLEAEARADAERALDVRR